MPTYLGAIDQGTSSTRFIVFDDSTRIVAESQMEHAQIYPQPGWVEHDPIEIWRNTQTVIAGAMRSGGLRPSDLAAIGITNQRETTVVWDRRTGRAALQRPRVAGHARRRVPADVHGAARASSSSARARACRCRATSAA